MSQHTAQRISAYTAVRISIVLAMINLKSTYGMANNGKLKKKQNTKKNSYEWSELTSGNKKSRTKRAPSANFTSRFEVCSVMKYSKLLSLFF